MKLPKLLLVSAFFTTSTTAFEICRIGDEINILDNDSMRALRKDNYSLFSDDITVDALFSSTPEHFTELKPSIIEANELYSKSSSLLDLGPSSILTIEADAAKRLLQTLGRTSSKFATGALEVLGPIGDAAAVGFWAKEIGNTFKDESQTSYDRFATVMGLVDWFGVLKLPEREIDRVILSHRWDAISSGQHYSFNIHDDIATQQDLRNKKHWAELASKQADLVTEIVGAYAKDITLKYQYHYQEMVYAQAKLSNELISALDQELHKYVYTLLSFDHNGSRLFPSDLTSACDAETRVIASLYTNSNSNSSSSTPSTSEANGALTNLQLCQQSVLSGVVQRLDELRTGHIDQQAFTQAFKTVLSTKKQIANTASEHLEHISSALKKQIIIDGRQAVDRLFDSGALEKSTQFFKDQASRYAIDEMARSVLYRPATADELKTKTLVLNEGYRKCTSFGVLAGDPNFQGCRKYEWIPAETRKFEPAKDAVISQITSQPRQNFHTKFDAAILNLISIGWDANQEEQWFEQQITHYSQQQAAKNNAKKDRALVHKWLFGSDAQIKDECPHNCEGWNAGYLERQNISQHSSLSDISRWFADYSSSVSRYREIKLAELIPQALESEWQAIQLTQFLSYAHPGSFDLEKHAPLMASALKNSTLDLASLSGNSLQIAKEILKREMIEAINQSKQKGTDWLISQIGDFHRYAAIVHQQHTSTGHANDMPNDVLFTEELPGNVLRYTISHLPPYNYDQKLDSSLRALFDPQSVLSERFSALANASNQLNNQPGRECYINFTPVKKALLDINSDSLLEWIAPIHELMSSLTSQQLEVQASIEWAVKQQSDRKVACDLSPNNPKYL
ncbi:hypothetical protein PL85_11325 [Vibrio anguillarum]|nr:hypothetical protein [Vibrio anguillarum]MBF4283659.1 hypothetical protein [Vibrio anguillarum]MBF4288304.1 hypothetical protein [Vibrio anguillarum]MBF4342037.1 hypothetical protein [Vibrio anguillarum]MBF4358413.1 hypothetical protein [Vibrio anguillarum]MBF4380213.1 hypothetical protein [Vibrio anguillarum]